MTYFEQLINRLPEGLVQSLKDCMQDPVYHPEGDVYTHTRMVFEKAYALHPTDTDMHIAAIFHDIGKPETKEIKIKNDVERVSHYGHEFKALKYVDQYLHLYEDLKPNKERIVAMVAGHMRAHQYKDIVMKNPNKRRAFEEQNFFNDVMNFSECDKHIN